MAAVPLRSLMAKAAGPKRARRKAAISPLRCGCEPQAIRSTATTQRERQRLRRDLLEVGALEVAVEVVLPRSSPRRGLLSPNDILVLGVLGGFVNGTLDY